MGMFHGGKPYLCIFMTAITEFRFVIYQLVISIAGMRVMAALAIPIFIWTMHSILSPFLFHIGMAVKTKGLLFLRQHPVYIRAMRFMTLCTKIGRASCRERV